MADQVQTQETKKPEGKKALSTILKLLLGGALLVLGVMAIMNWKEDLFSVIRGCIGPFLILAAIITFAIAKE